MEWFSMPFKITDKQESQNGEYTNYYFVYDEEYVKDGKTKTHSVWQSVPKDIYDAFDIGDKVQLTRQTFFNNKKRYDFISEGNPTK